MKPVRVGKSKCCDDTVVSDTLREFEFYESCVVFDLHDLAAHFLKILFF